MDGYTENTKQSKIELLNTPLKDYPRSNHDHE
jgi:hypothetical protein